MISKDKIIEYQLINEKARYEAIKALTVAVKHICIVLIVCITLIACAYMYLVVPVEEITVDGSSKAAIQTTVDNGSQLWQ